MLSSDTKVEVSVGCVKFLEEEVTRLRQQNELLSAENQVMNKFFDMVGRLGPKPSQCYGEDRLWEAKKEIEEAIEKKKPTVKESSPSEV